MHGNYSRLSDLLTVKTADEVIEQLEQERDEARKYICRWCCPDGNLNNPHGFFPCPEHGGCDIGYELYDDPIHRQALRERDRAIRAEKERDQLRQQLKSALEKIESLQRANSLRDDAAFNKSGL